MNHSMDVFMYKGVAMSHASLPTPNNVANSMKSQCLYLPTWVLESSIIIAKPIYGSLWAKLKNTFVSHYTTDQLPGSCTSKSFFLLLL